MCPHNEEPMWVSLKREQQRSTEEDRGDKDAAMAKRCAAAGHGVGMVKLSTTTSLTKSAARAKEEYEKHNAVPKECLRTEPESKRRLLEGFVISLEHTRGHTEKNSVTESSSAGSAILDQD